MKRRETIDVDRLPAKVNAAVRKGIARIDAKRMKAGLCRHCGGPVPCYSPFGDVEVGRRHGERAKKSETRVDEDRRLR